MSPPEIRHRAAHGQPPSSIGQQGRRPAFSAAGCAVLKRASGCAPMLIGLVFVSMAGHPVAAAGPVSPPVTDPSPVATWVRIDAPQRLSHSWLSVLSSRAGDTRQNADARPADPAADPLPEAAAAYAPGLMWISPGARPNQRQQLRSLLAALSLPPREASGGPEALATDTPGAHRRAAATDTGPPDVTVVARSRLRQRLAAMPITGRVPLPAQDPHWLAANPHEDPELAPGDEWWLPIRPTVVRVMNTDGSDCDRPFVAGQAAIAYLRACEGGASTARDWAWLVQPDGRVQRVGLAAWNRGPEPLPAPGAWIWSPSREDDVPERASDALARWLATQGAAGTEGVPSAENLRDTSGDNPRALDTAPRGDTASATTPGARAGAASAPARPHSLPWNSGSGTPAEPGRGSPQPLASDWGVTGLLQTPTARTRPAGTVGMAVSRGYPYTRYNVVLSPYERLEVAVRYTSISNMLYGADIAGDQSNKDKSSELKWRLLDEGYWMPALAVGLRDPGGTGLFGGEYVVANKRFGDWDVSLGLGWGYLGQRGDLPNPLARMGLRPAERQGDRNAQGGTANLGSLFSGPTALFGGVQWALPWGSADAPWTFRLEWDGNDYADEARPGPLPTRTGWNAGLSGRWGDAEWGLSYQRGNRWTFNVAWFGSLSGLHTPKTAVPRPPAVLPMAAVPMAAVPNVTAPVPEPGQASALLAELSQHTGWLATALSTGPDHWQVQVEHASGAYLQERVERVWAVLHRSAPANVQRFSLELSSRQLPLVRYEVDRQTWSDARSRHIARHQQNEAMQGAPAPVAQEPQTDAMLNPQPDTVPRVFKGINLSYQQHIGGPDGYLYALSARAFGQWAVWDGAWLQGSLNLRLLDNYEHFKYTAPSALPRVRTLLREYVTTRRLTLPNLQATQVARLSPALYGMVYAGWLEPMFAGAGAEVLYRPLNSPWALGLDLNWVRQRAVEQDLGLGDYRVVTGHLTLRWDTGWHDVVAGVSAGQYLAGDRGVTVDLSRVFGNGTRMGVWATKTNVSAEQFGEGSFDKGLYFALPFDALFTRWSGSGATVAWQPLIRDGGAKLQRGASLWGLTELRDSRLQQWRSAGEAAVSPEKVE